MAQGPGPLPPPSTPWMDPPGTPSLSFRLYFLTLDAVARGLTGFFGAATFAKLTAPTAPGTLINAANDAAAATAGVQIGQFYRNGSVVQIRVT